MKHFIVIIGLFIADCFCFAQAPVIEWQKHLGGSNDDYPFSIIETFDHGFIVVGASGSDDHDVVGHHPGICSGGFECFDLFIVKLDSSGIVEWTKAYGGTSGDGGECVVQTPDSGYLISGVTGSNDGDVSGNHSGQGDCWIVKIDKYGTLEWQKCYGGSLYENALSVIASSDGAFVFAGMTESDDGDVIGHHHGRDYWVVKIDSVGNIIWQKCLGGYAYDDKAYSVKETADSGYLIAGGSPSIDGDVTGNHGMSDFWIVKLSQNGSLVWQKSFGGSQIDEAYYASPTSDGGFIMTGYSESNDIQVSGNHGLRDIWVAKVSINGFIQWQKSIGGSFMDEGMVVEPCANGGYLLFAYTDSNDGDVTGQHGFPSADFWLIKLSDAGNIEWKQCYGGSGSDVGYCGHQTTDGGFVLTGYSESNNGQVGGNYGFSDYWVVKLSPAPLGIGTPASAITDFTTYLNSARGLMFINFYANGNELTQLQLFDIAGRVLMSQPLAITAGFNKQQVHAGELGAGVYVVRLMSERGGITKKLIVQ